MPLSMGTFVSGYNSAFTIINSLVFVYRVSRGKTNPLASGWMQYVGLLAVVVGNLGEILIEGKRRAFKKDSRNEGKVYDQGELLRFAFRTYCSCLANRGLTSHFRFASSD